jgi:type IV secretion system protein TrbL
MANNTATTTDAVQCLTCKIVDEYVSLANNFTQDLSQALLLPMYTLFISLVGLWVVIQGIRLILCHTDLLKVAHEFLFVSIAALLLSGQGPVLVNEIFSITLQTMGAASSVALMVGMKENAVTVDYNSIGGGLHALMLTAENAIMKILQIGVAISSTTSVFEPLQWIYALLLIVPYFILWIAYFAQVVVSIFRIMILAILSPFMMLGFGFGWGRDMLKNGMRTVISSFIVLFTSTAVIGVLLYAISSFELDSQKMETTTIREFASITNVRFLLTVAMGWLGTAFMTEATGLANSITGSNFTNNAAGTIVAGALGTAAAVSQAPGVGGAQGLIGKAMSGAFYGAGKGVGAGIETSKRVDELIKKMKK